MSKHTPGPWAIEPDHDEIDGTVLVHGAADAPGLTPVALVYTADGFPCVEDDDRVAFEAECAANANLIAAAPDLLAACEAALASWEANDGEMWTVEALAHRLEQLRAAIRKARGE